MVRLWHYLAKDLGRLRLLVALWPLVVAAETILAGSGAVARVEDLRLQEALQILASLLSLLKLMLACVIVPLLIQEEPLVGTEAFWLTRPIPRGTLLLSKLSFVGAFMIVPALVAELALMAASGVITRHLLLAAPEILLKELTWFLCLAVLASLTPNFARFALVGAGLLAALVLLGLTLALVFSSEEVRAEIPVPVPDSSPVVVALLLIIAVSLWVLGHQYRTRKTWRSAALALVGAFLVLLLSDYWPWPFLKAEEPRLEIRLPQSVRLTADIGKTWVSDMFSLRRKRRAQKNVSARLRIQGLPAAYAATPVAIRPRLEFAGGSAAQEVRNLLLSVPPDVDPSEPLEFSALRQALGGLRLHYDERFRPSMWPVFVTVDDEFFSRHGKEPGEYSADFVFRVDRYQIVCRLPLRPGARYDNGSEHVVITDVLRQSEGCTVILRESNVNVLLEPRMWPTTRYVFANPGANEAALAREFPLQTSALHAALWDVTTEPGTARLMIRYLELRFPEERLARKELPPINETWLSQGQLVRIDASYAGRFSKSLQVPGFRMDTR